MIASGAYETAVVMPLPLDNDSGLTGGFGGSMSDHHLVIAAQAGCRTAFRELWDLYSQRVYGTVLRITKNRQDAEDALQDAFLRAFISLKGFECRSSFYSWVTRIAINSALGVLRKRRCRPETSLDQTSRQEEDCVPEEVRDPAADPEQSFEERERCATLMHAIHKLPVSLREAVQVRIAEECTLKEVAFRLNISEAAAKSRLYRARIRLGVWTSVRCEKKARTTDAEFAEALPG